MLAPPHQAFTVDDLDRGHPAMPHPGSAIEDSLRSDADTETEKPQLEACGGLEVA